MQQRKALRRVNRQREKENEQYRRESRIFLISNPVCQLCRLLPSTQVHHAAGRERKLLLVKKYWRALCGGCHDWAGRHKQQAIARGISVSRSVTTKGK